MRHPIVKIVGLATAAPLAGALFLAAAPAASAAPASTAAATAKAEPYSSFYVVAKGPKKAKAGSRITYTVGAVNQGPHLADTYFVGGQLPKGIERKVYYSAPKGTGCAFFPDGFWCVVPRALEVDDAVSFSITVKLKKGARGTALARVGVDQWDVPNGAEDLNRRAWKELGVKHWYFLKTVKTKIVR
ncbi:MULTISPECIES: DUF11 domain-containing protein [Microbispora]|uniref:DUF11 domain-containing protein n=1 Tax=Microbispora triticiradicis TaxID=2200763 RepID=A0ABX9LCT0_9ACTN|nr:MULTISPECIES: DUF11 domain-containing protein [Microbispora]RGA01770.1 hypothetical protein DI270_027655 [Microbispora triticiradicis]